jgi:hypothetical protein
MTGRSGHSDTVAIAAGDGVPLSPFGRRFLRYWSLNVVLARSSGYRYLLGFPYTETEQRRIDTIGRSIPNSAVLVWLSAAVAIFIALALAGVVGIMVPALTLLWPDPAKMPGLGFASVMALIMILALGFGMPIAIAFGGAVADRLADVTPPEWAPGDAALYAKIRSQFLRLAAIFSIAFIPGLLIYISLGIDAEWIGTVLHAATGAIALFGLLCHAASRRAGKTASDLSL